MNKTDLTIQFSARQRKTALGLLLLANLLMLAGTLVFNRYWYDVIYQDWRAGSGVKWFLLQFNLATENVFAVWYSSMLLLAASLACLLCFVVDVQRFKRGTAHYLSYGWVMMALVFGLLSLDEMGSIHEKVGNMSRLNPFGDYPLGWIYLLGVPIGLVGLLMLGFGLIHLRRTPLTMVFTALGILLFLSIPLQEYFETKTWHAAPDRSHWRRPVLFLLLEEGAELFGTFSFLVATTFYMLRAGTGENATGTAPRAVIRLSFTRSAAVLTVSLLIGAATASLLLLGWMEAYLAKGKGMEGIAQNWYPSAGGFLIAAVCLYLFTRVQSTLRSVKANYLLLTLLNLGVSAYFGSSLYRFTLWKEDLSAQLVHGTLALAVILVGVQTIVLVKNFWGRLGVIAWVVLLGFAFSTGKAYVAEIAFLACASLLLSLVAHLSQEQHASKTPLVHV